MQYLVHVQLLFTKCENMVANYTVLLGNAKDRTKLTPVKAGIPGIKKDVIAPAFGPKIVLSYQWVQIIG